MNTMQKALNLPKIALGAWAWGSGAAGGDQVFGNHMSLEELKPVFEKSLAEGLNLWDTAAVYGMGSSETMLGELMKAVPREAVLLSTKFTPQIAEEVPNPAEKMIEDSFERLHTDIIDIYWIHNPADVARWTPELIPLAKAGKVKFIGVSNHNLDEIKLANSILAKEELKVSALQNHYSLLHRSSEDAGILEYAKENDMTFFSYMVLEQGALSGKYDTAHPFPEGSDRAAAYNDSLPQLETMIKSMSEIAERHHGTVAQIATAWAIAKGTVPIIGVTKVNQVEDAANAAKINLSTEEIDQLEELAQATGVKTLREWEKPMA
ncbi:aldo/keto reductase [Candidatus Enterococcus ferrettii]|uniref:NADP-dependent oxidoreductase domain-containing protein n=1 Tax=Candidatus Enterococcus ferrettii TaxID=2815324 RepID=A0ABV0ET74_9ENTE|nr:aldo/keto reductase [Enterococcus sp. 665A]MBO1343141.1 aldo/keto reductase [Enterococcus sp. 665A]